MLAAEAKQIEVGKLLITEFPRCVPWSNKSGMDTVGWCFHISTTVHLLLGRHIAHIYESMLGTSSYDYSS